MKAKKLKPKSNQTSSTDNASKQKKKVSEHLSELRRRLFICLFSFILMSVVAYVFHENLLLFGFLFSLPVFIYQLASFVSPVFSRQSKKMLITYAIFSTILLLLGVTFAYYICLPAAFSFLEEFNSSKVQSLVGSSEYFAFVSRYVLGFGLIFQLPLILLLINHVYALNSKFLFKISPYIILASFVISAIITPTPDLINQSIMAVPILILYYLSILLLFTVNAKNKKKK